MSLISKNDCVEVLRSKLGDDNFQLEDFTLKYFEELMGFHANHAGLTIKAILGGNVTDFRFFVKTLTDNPLIKEKYWDVLRQFYKEHIFLTDLVKTLQKFVEEKITAECYLSKQERVCVLEDLCGLGYEASRMACGDMAHAERSVRAFANLHASAILYEEKTGVILEEKYKDINYESLFFEDDKHPNEFLLYSVDKGVQDVGDKFFQHVSAEVRYSVFSKIRRRTTEVLNHSKKYRKVVCQGDPWGNNILYKYDNEGKPVESILVDFGVMRFAPPALDLMQFLYLGTETSFRVKYKSQIKDLYYQHLSYILSENGVEVSTVMPRKQFLESCDVYEEFGICCRVYYTYVTRLPKQYLQRAADSVDKFLDLMARGNAELGLEAFEKDVAYRELLTEVIEDAFRYYKQPIS